ncbi:MAG: PQQ-dependent sugar dehydrogenase [Aliishimia sp.]
MRQFITIMAFAVTFGTTAASTTLTIERVTPRVSGQQIIEIRAPESESSDGYLLSSRDGSILRRDPVTGAIETVLSGITDPAGFQLAYSMTFAPDFETSGKVYVSYGTDENTHVVAEFGLSTTDPTLFDASTQRTVLTIQHDRPNNHYGADIEFGPDGYLYVTTGDGNEEVTTSPNVSQDVTNRLGSVLRIDPTGDAFPTDTQNNYSVPLDNPDFGTDADPALFAIGLRNPFRATFDSETGTYFVADVGEDNFEEVNIVTAGANFGWNAFEGEADGPAPAGLSSEGDVTDPLLALAHDDAQSITGGLVYRGDNPDLDALLGQYIFADFSTDKIFSIDETSVLGSTPLVTEYDLNGDIAGLRRIVAFGTDGAGNLFVSNYFGDLYQITAASTLAATPVSLPASMMLILSALVGLRTLKRDDKAIQQG